MNIKISSKIFPTRFYQDCHHDSYQDFNEEEKIDLKSFLESHKFKKVLETYLKGSCTFHGSIDIKNILISKNINSNNALPFLMNVDLYTNNIDNYTAKKVKNIIIDNFEHYYRSDLIPYGKEYFYSIDKNIDNAGIYYKDFKYIADPCDVEMGNDENCIKKIYLYANNNLDRVLQGQNNCNISIKDLLVAIDNEDYWNKIGTNSINHKRNCQNNTCKFYCYDNNNRENLLINECNYADNINDVIKYMEDLNAKYWYITDIQHTVLYEKITD